ncbi:MAG: RDD family protein [Nannocystaceae bacterium]|nr:RDD family protein [Myxococcales bacterium]
MKRGSSRRRPGPCPACDAAVEVELADAETAACPRCGATLVPVRVAGFWRRTLALAIDGLVLLLTAGPLHAAVLHFTGQPWPPMRLSLLQAGLLFASADPLPALLWALPFLAMAALYVVLFTVLKGQTLGQRLARVHVVNRSGERPGILAATLRVFGIGAGLVPVGLGGLWIAFDREKRALHDHVAGTYVVRET